uniref:Uncharacterized protein n=1 Tax=Anguilla anguilla TaxID=7936 RepID=A0A0E9PF81_ANGAN
MPEKGGSGGAEIEEPPHFPPLNL